LSEKLGRPYIGLNANKKEASKELDKLQILVSPKII
jgi:hypothetical protein